MVSLQVAFNTLWPCPYANEGTLLLRIDRYLRSCLFSQILQLQLIKGLRILQKSMAVFIFVFHRRDVKINIPQNASPAGLVYVSIEISGIVPTPSYLVSHAASGQRREAFSAFILGSPPAASDILQRSRQTEPI